ncbi:MAG: ABC transporter substrate-binding protein [Firmicutes bacterium]|nr:ABC transporter substrate-binding protein [Bacillota bacterium]
MKARVLRILTVTLLLLLAVSSLASARVTITYWTHTHPPMVDLTKELIAEFEKENPDIQVEYTAIPNNQFFTKMLTSMSTGTGPDVFNMSSTRITAYLGSDAVVPVIPSAFGYKNQAELENAWVKGTLKAASKDGKIYGIPSEYNVSALVINAAHFKEAGLNPNNPPRTWDELKKHAEKLTVRKGNQIVRRGFDFFYLPNFYWLDFGVLLGQQGGHILSANGKESVINGEAGVKALQTWYDMVYKDKVAGPQYSLKDSTNPMIDYVNGNVSMFLAYPWSIGLLKDTPVWKDSVIVPLPQMDPAHPVTHAYGYYWMVSKTSKHPEASWKFVNFLSSHPERWLKDVSFIQPRKGWTNLPEAKAFPYIEVWLGEMGKSSFGDMSPYWAEISAAIQRAVENSIMNGVAPKAALAQAKSEIDAALKQ